MGYKQNNPLPMMKSALKMEKAMRKSGMHRESAMYMGHESPAELGHSPMEMGHSPMEMGHESPAKKYDSPAMESRELKDMPIVDIEKGDAKGSPAKAAKPDYIDIDGDGNKEESMKEAAKDKKGSPAKKYDRVVFGGNKGDKSKTKPGKKDFEGKGSPAKKYDKVVLGGNKGDKSKTKPGKKDYSGNQPDLKKYSEDKKKGSPAKDMHKMSRKQMKDHARTLRTAAGKETKKDKRKNKREHKRTMRHVKKHGSGLIMD